MHLVLSCLRTGLEDALLARGRRVAVITPESIADERRERAAGRYPVCGLRSWHQPVELAAVAEEFRRHPVSSVDTTDEQCLSAAAYLRAALGLPGQSPEQAEQATDKAVMKEALARAGVPVAAHRRIGGVAELRTVGDVLGWPLVVKPRLGFGTLGTRVVRGPAELDRLLADGAFDARELPTAFHGSGLQFALDAMPGGLMAEEFVDLAAEYHCELLRHRGEELYAVPARYAVPLLGADVVGSVVLPSGPEHDRVVALARDAADALGLETGFAHVELLRDRDGRWRVGELGLRPGGGQLPRLLRLHHGIDVAEAAADLAMGLRPAVRPDRPAGATAWVSAVTPSGLITGMTPAERIRALPDVVDAHTDLAPGRYADGGLGTVALGVHVYTRAATAERAERSARAALRAWDLTLADRPVAVAS